MDCWYGRSSSPRVDCEKPKRPRTSSRLKKVRFIEGYVSDEFDPPTPGAYASSDDEHVVLPPLPARPARSCTSPQLEAHAVQAAGLAASSPVAAYSCMLGHDSWELATVMATFGTDVLMLPGY